MHLIYIVSGMAFIYLPSESVPIFQTDSSAAEQKPVIQRKYWQLDQGGVRKCVPLFMLHSLTL